MAWWENTNIIGTSWTKHLIDGSASQPMGVQAVDMDKDGDTDVVIGELTGNTFSWWENTDNFGTAWSQHIIDNNFSGAYQMHCADLDYDGDIDVVGQDNSNGTISWWENTDGIGTSWSEYNIKQIPFYYTRGIFISDIDDDGDLDVIGAYYSGNSMLKTMSGDGQRIRIHGVNRPGFPMELR